jgi:hypothetical protein
MSRQALAAQPAAATSAAEPGQHAGLAEPDSGTADAGRAREGVAGERAAPVPVGRWVPDGVSGRLGVNGKPGPADRSDRGSGPGRGRGRTGPAARRIPRDRLGVIGRGRGRLLAFGAAAATGVAVAAVVLTQFLTSPAAQTTGAGATPSAHVTSSRPAGAARPTSHPLPSADATSTSVLASASPPPVQVLDQIQATIRRGVASGQIRQDVGVDLTNLLQPVQAELAAGNTAGVSQLAGTLKAKLATRLGEGAITKAAVTELDRELATLAKSLRGSG